MPGWLAGLFGFAQTALKALGLWKVKQAGKTKEQRDALERELQAVDDAEAARDALDDTAVRDELHDYRRRRDGG